MLHLEGWFVYVCSSCDVEKESPYWFNLVLVNSSKVVELKGMHSQCGWWYEGWRSKKLLDSSPPPSFPMPCTVNHLRLPALRVVDCSKLLSLQIVLPTLEWFSFWTQTCQCHPWFWDSFGLNWFWWFGNLNSKSSFSFSLAS